MTLNQNLTICSEPTLKLPPLPSSINCFDSLSITATVGTPSIILTFTPAIENSMKVKLYMTAPQSAGVNFVKCEYRLLTILSSTDLTELDLYSLYIARWPAGFVAGSKIFIKTAQVNRSTGQQGIERAAYCILAD
jgi:hypothetical protein